jgi:hypothetical protein
VGLAPVFSSDGSCFVILGAGWGAQATAMHIRSFRVENTFKNFSTELQWQWVVVNNTEVNQVQIGIIKFDHDSLSCIELRFYMTSICWAQNSSSGILFWTAEKNIYYYQKPISNHDDCIGQAQNKSSKGIRMSVPLNTQLEVSVPLRK